LATLKLVPVVENVQQPTLVLPVPGSTDLLVVEQGGIASLVRSGAKVEPAFLDIRDIITAGGEQGFLGFAFSPTFAASGVAYASYTDANGDDVVSRYHLASGTRERLDPGSREEILHLKDPYPNHNGGNVVFGPDGMMWFGAGDGGSGGDPEENGQDKDALLGSMLRLKVADAGAYGIPDDNPWATGGGAKEVYAKGLRNPWRFSFDLANGDLWIGDVGQNAHEEIDRLPANTHGVINFGWNVYEGKERYRPSGSAFSDVTMPVAEYPTTSPDCAVTGGYVYRGPAIQALHGVYLFSDYCSGILRELRLQADGSYAMATVMETGLHVSSFGQDSAGELYVVDHGGEIDKIVAV
jgi:glucose/arabinose dehydrogenase